MARKTGVEGFDFAKPPPGWDPIRDPDDVPEAGALTEQALQDAQVDVRSNDEAVCHLRRMLGAAEQKLQRSRARARKLAGVSVEAFLAPPNLRPEDLARERASIPSGSIRCAHWEEGERTVCLGLQLGDGGPGFWVEVPRHELGYYAASHAGRLQQALDERVVELLKQPPGAESLDVASCEVSWLADPNRVGPRFEGFPFDVVMPDAAAKAMAGHILLTEMATLKTELDAARGAPGDAAEYFARLQAWRAWGEDGREIAGSAMMDDDRLREEIDLVEAARRCLAKDHDLKWLHRAARGAGYLNGLAVAEKLRPRDVLLAALRAGSDARRDLDEMAKRRPVKGLSKYRVGGETFDLPADIVQEMANIGLRLGVDPNEPELLIAVRAVVGTMERVRELEAGIKLAQDELDAVAEEDSRDRQDVGRTEAARILRRVL